MGIVRSQDSPSGFICALRPICAEAWDATGTPGITAAPAAAAAPRSSDRRGVEGGTLPEATLLRQGRAQAPASPFDFCLTSATTVAFPPFICCVFKERLRHLHRTEGTEYVQ